DYWSILCIDRASNRAPAGKIASIRCAQAFRVAALARGPPESLGVAAPLQGRDGDEPATVPETVAAPGSTAPDVERGVGRGVGGIPRGLSKPVPVQPRVPASVRPAAAA